MSTQENNNTNGEKKEEKKMWGTLPEGAKMEWDTVSLPLFSQEVIINSAALANAISKEMRNTFSDYKGCNLFYDKIGVYVEFYFGRNANAANNPNMVSSVVSKYSEKIDRKDIAAIKQRELDIMSGRLFMLNDETKLLLSEFYNNDKLTPDSNEWYKYVKVEIMPATVGYGNPFNNVQNGNLAENVELVVTGMNINKVVNKLLGSKFHSSTEIDDDGEAVNIYTTACRIVSLHSYNTDGTFNISIKTFDAESIYKTHAEIVMRNGGTANSSYARIMY